MVFLLERLIIRKIVREKKTKKRVNSDRPTLDELNIVYSHIGVHYIYMVVGLIVQTTHDNNYDIGK